MQSKWKIESNLQHTCGVMKVFHAKQYDANTRYIEVTIMDGAEAFSMPSNPVFMVGVRSADGTEYLYDAIVTATCPLNLTVTIDTEVWAAHGVANTSFTYDGTNWKRSGSVVNLADWGITVSGTPANGDVISVTSTSAVSYTGNVVTFAIHPTAFLQAGDAEAELYIASGNELISTFIYTLRVQKAAVNYSTAVTPTSFALLTKQIEAYVNAWLTAHPEATTTVQDGSITTAKLASQAVTEGKIASNAVTTGKLASGAVTDAKLDPNGLRKTVSDLDAAIRAGTMATAAYHLGLYIDDDGDLCQVDTE